MASGDNGPPLIKGKRAVRVIKNKRERERVQDKRTYGKDSMYVRIDEAKRRAALLRQPATDDPFESFIQRIQKQAYTDDLIGQASAESGSTSYLDKKEKRHFRDVVGESQNESRLARIFREGAKYAPEPLNTESANKGPEGSTPESRFEFFKANQAKQDSLLEAMGISKQELNFKNDTYNTKKFMQGDFSRYTLGAAARSAGYGDKAAEDVIGTLTGMVDGDILPQKKKKAGEASSEEEESGNGGGGGWDFGSFTDGAKNIFGKLQDNKVTGRAIDAVTQPGGLLFGDKLAGAAVKGFTHAVDEISRPLYGVMNTALEVAKLDDDNAGAEMGEASNAFDKLTRGVMGGWAPRDSMDEIDQMREDGDDPATMMWNAFKDGFSKREKTTAQDVISYNASRRADKDHWMQGGIYQGFAGFAGDVIFDPISWVPGGALLAGGKATSKVATKGKSVVNNSRVGDVLERKSVEKVTKDWTDGKITEEEFNRKVRPVEYEQGRKNKIIDTSRDLRELNLTRKDFKGTAAERFFDERGIPSKSNVGEAEIPEGARNYDEFVDNSPRNYNDYVKQFDADVMDDTPVGIDDYARMLGINASASTYKSRSAALRDVQEYTGAIEGKVSGIKTGATVTDAQQTINKINQRITNISKGIEDVRATLGKETTAQVMAESIRSTQTVAKADDIIKPDTMDSFATNLIHGTESVDLDGLVSTHFGDSLGNAVEGVPISVREAVEDVVTAFNRRSVESDTPYFKGVNDDNKPRPTGGWAKQKSQYDAAKARMLENENKVKQKRFELQRALASEDSVKASRAQAALSKAEYGYNKDVQDVSRILSNALSSRFAAEISRAKKIAAGEDNVSKAFYAAPEGKIAALNALKARALAKLDEPAVSNTGSVDDRPRTVISDTEEAPKNLYDMGFDSDDYHEGMLESVFESPIGLDSHQHAEAIIRMADNELKNLESPVGTPHKFTVSDLPNTFKADDGLDPELADFFQVRQDQSIFIDYNGLATHFGRSLTDYEVYTTKVIADKIRNFGYSQGQRIRSNDTRAPREQITKFKLDHMMKDMIANPSIYNPQQVEAATLLSKYYKFDKSSGGYALVIQFNDGGQYADNLAGKDFNNMMRKSGLLKDVDERRAVQTKALTQKLRDSLRGKELLTADEAKALHAALSINARNEFPSLERFVNMATTRQTPGSGSWVERFLKEYDEQLITTGGYLNAYSPGKFAYARNALEAKVSVAKLHEARRIVMWNNPQGANRGGQARARRLDKAHLRANNAASNTTDSKVLEPAKKIEEAGEKATYFEQIVKAKEALFRNPALLEHEYPKLITLKKAVEAEGDEITGIEKLVKAPEGPKTIGERADAKRRALKVEQRNEKRMLDQVSKELSEHPNLDDDMRRQLATVSNEIKGLRQKYTDEMGKLNRALEASSKAERVMQKIMDDANLLRIASMEVTNPHLRGPLSNWSAEGLLEVPGFNQVIKGFDRMNSPEFLQRVANESGKFRNAFSDPHGGRARFTNLYGKFFGSHENMSTEFQLMRARFMGQTPRILEHHIGRLNKGLRPMKPKDRKSALISIIRNEDGPNVEVLSQELDRLIPYFSGQIYPDMTVNDITRFLPKEMHISNKQVTAMSEEGVNRMSIASLLGNDDPLEEVWRLNVAVEQAVGYASLKHDLKAYGVQMQAVSKNGKGKPYFSEAQRKAIKSGNKNKQYRKWHSPIQAEAINSLKSKGWKEIEDFEGHLFPPELVPEINRLLSITDPRHFNKFENVIDGATRSWKALLTVYNPNYYTTNLFGEVMSGWLGGVDNPLRYTEAAGVLKYASRNKDYEGFLAKNGWDAHVAKPESGGKRIFTRQGQDITQADVAVLFKEVGLDTGFINTEVSANLNNLAPGKRFARLNRAHQGVRKFGETVEDLPRIAHFIDAMDKAPAHLSVRDAADYAAEMVRKYHFDYSDLSNVEKTYAARAFPFYTFTRKVLPLYAKMMIQKPRRFTAVNKAYANISMATGPVEGGGEMDGLLEPNYDEFDNSDWASAANFIPMGDFWFKPQDPMNIARTRMDNAGFMAQVMTNPMLKMANQLPAGPDALADEAMEVIPQIQMAKDAGVGKTVHPDGNETENKFDLTKLLNSSLGTGLYKNNSNDFTPFTDFNYKYSKADMGKLMKEIANGR